MKDAWFGDADPYILHPIFKSAAEAVSFCQDRLIDDIVKIRSDSVVPGLTFAMLIEALQKAEIALTGKLSCEIQWLDAKGQIL